MKIENVEVGMEVTLKPWDKCKKYENQSVWNNLNDRKRLVIEKKDTDPELNIFVEGYWIPAQWLKRIKICKIH